VRLTGASEDAASRRPARCSGAQGFISKRVLSRLWSAEDRERGSRPLNGDRTTEDRRDVQATPPPVSDDFFREVNARILELGSRFGLGSETLELICECGDTTCTERFSILCSAYAEVREAAGRRVVVTGHERTCGVIARGDRYVVVCD
jgi:hypothetical protein